MTLRDIFDSIYNQFDNLDLRDVSVSINKFLRMISVSYPVYGVTTITLDAVPSTANTYPITITNFINIQSFKLNDEVMTQNEDFIISNKSIVLLDDDEFEVGDTIYLEYKEGYSSISSFNKATDLGVSEEMFSTIQSFVMKELCLLSKYKKESFYALYEKEFQLNYAILKGIKQITNFLNYQGLNLWRLMKSRLR